jgi:hypothetical protein
MSRSFGAALAAIPRHQQQPNHQCRFPGHGRPGLAVLRGRQLAAFPAKAICCCRIPSTADWKSNIANSQIVGAAFLGAVGLDWQFAGVAPAHGPGTSDLILRNVKTGQFEVYNTANNQITGAALLGAVGLSVACRRSAELRRLNLSARASASAGSGQATAAPATSDVRKPALDLSDVVRQQCTACQAGGMPTA